MDNDGLATLLTPLKERGFNTDLWTLEEFFRLKQDIDGFLVILKWFIRHSDEIVNAALVRGIGPVGWAAVDTCTPVQMYSYLSWLKDDEDGKLVIGKASREHLVDKMRKDGQSREEDAMMYAFLEQLKELAAVERLYLSEPNRLTGAIIFKELESVFKPAVFYRGPDQSKLSSLCVDLHTRKEPGARLTTTLIKYCKTTYKSEAERNHKIEFLKNVDIKKHLVKWIGDKIVELGNIIGELGDKEGAFAKLNTFVACAEAAGCQVASPVLYLLTKGPTRMKKKRASSSGGHA